MKKRTERVLLCLFVLLCGTKASAQWTVFDPSNLVQSIINSTNEMVETSSTAATMIKNFEETARIYRQAQKRQQPGQKRPQGTAVRSAGR